MNSSANYSTTDLTTTLGGTLQRSIQKNKSVDGYGYSTDALLENMSAASSIFVTDNIINLTGRRDGSSRFGSGNRFASFGAVGAVWIFSNENFVPITLHFIT